MDVMETSTPIRRLVMVGACYVDTILNVPWFPKEDEKLRATSLERRRGGNCGNSLEVLQQLQKERHQFQGQAGTTVGGQAPVELVLLCVLPARSSVGTELIRSSLGPGVDTSWCIHREDRDEAASSYIVRAKRSGSRTVLNYNGLPEMTLAEFQDVVTAMEDRDAARGVGPVKTWFHFEGREVDMTRGCMRWLRRRGQQQHQQQQQRQNEVLLSVEVEKASRRGLGMLAAEADVVFYSRSWAENLDYTDTGAILRSQAALLSEAKLLCCTWGAEGAAAIRPADMDYHHHFSAFGRGQRVVDSVGAGDTFIAGILHALTTLGNPSGDLSYDDMRRALAFAVGLASRKVFQNGFAGLTNGLDLL